MLRRQHFLARAEQLRMLMLTASDPAAAVRLRGFVRKYRQLADRAEKLLTVAPSSVDVAAPLPTATRLHSPACGTRRKAAPPAGR